MATILICVALIAVGSYALFSDTVRINNHLQAGDLNIKLWRVDLEGQGLDANGYMSDIGNDTDKAFSDPTVDNIFDLDNTKYVVPTSKYTAEMMISRSASTNVAIGYWLDFAVKTPDTTDTASIALLKQIIITVQVYNRTTGAYEDTAIKGKALSELNIASVNQGYTHYNLGAKDDCLDVIGMNEYIEDTATDNIDTALAADEEAIAMFKVSVEFKDDLDFDHIIDGDGNLVKNDENNNNAAANGSVEFDLIVNAIQVVA